MSARIHIEASGNSLAEAVQAIDLSHFSLDALLGEICARGLGNNFVFVSEDPMKLANEQALAKKTASEKKRAKKTPRARGKRKA
jgi:hypothetical protein